MGRKNVLNDTNARDIRRLTAGTTAIVYTPDEGTDWNGPPATVAAGLDEAASRVKINETAIAALGSGTVDVACAAEVGDAVAVTVTVTDAAGDPVVGAVVNLYLVNGGAPADSTNEALDDPSVGAFIESALPGSATVIAATTGAGGVIALGITDKTGTRNDSNLSLLAVCPVVGAQGSAAATFVNP